MFVTDGFEHFDGHNLVKGAAHVAIVTNLNINQMRQTRRGDARRGFGVLLVRERQTSDFTLFRARHANGARAPPAADFEHAVARFDVRARNHGINFRILRRLEVRFLLLERFKLVQYIYGYVGVVNIAVNCTRVEHRVIQKQFVKVISGVVVILDVLPRALFGVTQRLVRCHFHLGTDPVHDGADHTDRVCAHLWFASRVFVGVVRRGMSLANCVQKRIQICVEIAIHVAFTQANVSAQNGLQEKSLIEHGKR
mmetsp:Transcript_246/g.639  ORF Transcript_246/g.639 Transcript_246/m.639 type:complete len:253 (-) Transcript_246:1559-2317(-)